MDRGCGFVALLRRTKRVEEGAVESGMNSSSGNDAPAAKASEEEEEKTQWEQEQRRRRNSEELEGEEVEKEKGQVATRMDRCEEGDADRLPVASLSASASAPFSVVNNPTQLAIFFDGSVCVYDDVPLERIQAILLIAAATASAARTSSPVLLTFPSLQSCSTSPHNRQQMPENTGRSIGKLQAELPLARRNSLQRFLEKRRDRLVSRAPYPPVKSSDSPGSGAGSESSTPDVLC